MYFQYLFSGRNSGFFEQERISLGDCISGDSLLKIAYLGSATAIHWTWNYKATGSSTIILLIRFFFFMAICSLWKQLWNPWIFHHSQLNRSKTLGRMSWSTPSESMTEGIEEAGAMPNIGQGPFYHWSTRCYHESVSQGSGFQESREHLR